MTQIAGRGAPKTLLVTRNFPPLRGGMERLNSRMFDRLFANEPASALVGPAGCARYSPPGSCIAEIAAGPLPVTLLSMLSNAIMMARRIRPDVVLAGSGLAAPAAVLAARVISAVPAVYLHGLDIIAPSRLYRAAWLPFIRACSLVIVNSENTKILAINAGVDSNRIRVVHPGTDLPSPDSDARARFRARCGLGAATSILLSVGRLTARKGIAEFVDQALPEILRARSDVHLVIIGDHAPQALHRGLGAGIERIHALARARGVSANVHWMGPCNDAELSDAYQGSDLHIFPVRSIPGDVEGFGMVAIEAAAHGLLTIAFDVGGVADAVVIGKSGFLIPPGDYPAFARAVENTLAKKVPQADLHAIAQRFSWDRFGREVGEALRQVT